MNRATLLKRVADLELRLGPRETKTAAVLRTATDTQLDMIEAEVVRGRAMPCWRALVAAHVARDVEGVASTGRLVHGRHFGGNGSEATGGSA